MNTELSLKILSKIYNVYYVISFVITLSVLVVTMVFPISAEASPNQLISHFTDFNNCSFTQQTFSHAGLPKLTLAEYPSPARAVGDITVSNPTVMKITEDNCYYEGNSYRFIISKYSYNKQALSNTSFQVFWEKNFTLLPLNFH